MDRDYSFAIFYRLYGFIELPSRLVKEIVIEQRTRDLISLKLSPQE